MSENLIIDERSLDTVFQEDFNFKGTAICQKSIMVKGSFEGRIVVQEDIYISSTSTVKADIEAKNLVLQGNYKGNSKIEDTLSLHQTSVFTGNASVLSFEAQKGSLFNGTLKMTVLSEDKEKNSE